METAYADVATAQSRPERQDYCRENSNMSLSKLDIVDLIDMRRLLCTMLGPPAYRWSSSLSSWYKLWREVHLIKERRYTIKKQVCLEFVSFLRIARL